MATNRRLIVVSNRLPISLERKGDSYAVTASSGGLVTALRAVFRKYEGCWIGWPGSEYSPAVEDLLRSVPDLEFQVHPVFLTQEERQKFYSGFSNEIVWPLFHDLQSRCNFRPDYWDSYLAINNRFAERIAQVAHENDFIWVHDYHLTAVAASLRRMGRQSPLAYFQHIPFPSPDIFEKLPWRAELLNSMLDFDLVGFQTRRDRRNFAVCVDRFAPEAKISASGRRMMVEHAGRKTAVGDFPISIDFDEFSTAAAGEEVADLASQIRADMRGRSLVLGVDRLDYTKGLPEKFRAFSHMLESYPHLRRNVTFVQVVVPSRENIPKYDELKREVERLIGEINGRFTDSGWAPIHFIYRQLERKQLLAYYRAADVALVTPLKDGMNLVAKEYCAAHVEEPGALVLSEFAGSAPELSCGALLVNPNDVIGVANALHTALSMDRNERMQRMQALRGAIQRADVYQWGRAFLEASGGFMQAKENPGELPSAPAARKQPRRETSVGSNLLAIARGASSAFSVMLGKKTAQDHALT